MSRYAAVVSTLAFGFQIFILEPWHHQISNEIQELKQMVKKK